MTKTRIMGYIIIVIGIILISSGIIITYIPSDKTKKPEDFTEIQKEYTFFGHEYTNITIFKKENKYIVKFTVTNKGDTDIEQQLVNFIFKNKSDEKLGTLVCTIPATKAQESMNLEFETSENILNTHDIETEMLLVTTVTG